MTTALAAPAPAHAHAPTELALEAEQVSAACARVEALELPDQAALDELGSATKEIKARLKFLEGSRRGRTDPLMAEVEIIRDEYRAVEGAYKSLELACKSRLGRHAQEAARAREAAQLEASKAHQAGNAPAAFQALMTAPPPVQTAGVSFRDEWVVEIVDPTLVPRNLCRVDEAAVLAFVKATDGQQLVPGVRAFKRAAVAVRGR